MDILGIIPARGGSKGIPGKNLKALSGKPMIDYTIQACLQSAITSRSIVSTDDETIAAFARETGMEVPFVRPAYLSNDTALMIDVVRHALEYLQKHENYSPDAVLLLQPTSPFRTAVHVREAVQNFVNTVADTLVSTVRVPHQFIPESIYTLRENRLIPVTPGKVSYDRHQKPSYLARNGPAILISTRETIEQGSFYGNTVLSYEMDAQSSIDIDTPFDFLLAESLMQQK